MSAGTCRKCGAALVKASRGRPRRYCSDGCRRAVEYELRRLQTAIEGVENQLRMCAFGWGGRRESDAPVFEAERVRLEERLRVLLDDPDPGEVAG